MSSLSLCDSCTAPGPVSNLTLETTHDSLKATWTPPEGNYSSFNVTLQLVDNIEDEDNVTDQSKTFVGLKAAANYTVMVYTLFEHLRGLSVQSSKFTRESLLVCCFVFCFFIYVSKVKTKMKDFSTGSFGDICGRRCVFTIKQTLL